MRVPQQEGDRGSLKWIQKAVAQRTPALERPILERTRSHSIEWRSPLPGDEYAEYRDGAFLERLGLERLTPALDVFWPRRGPQWDALGLTDNGAVLLVEAKAHVREICSERSKASEVSRGQISARLEEAAAALGAKKHRAAWIDHFYQLANRMAHLRFLRDAGVPAWLILVNFVGDRDMNGPSTVAEWQAAYEVAWHVMGLSSARPHPFLIELFPKVEELQ